MKVMDLTGSKKDTGAKKDGERETERRLTVLEVNMENQIPPKDIVGKLASISESISSLSELNTAQHQESKRALDDLTDCIRGNGPHSLQSQIMTINERAFGDNPTSLKSRITEQEGVTSSRIAWFAGASTAAGFVLFKWHEILEWLKAVAEHAGR
jgi:hypothetical protein